MFINLKDREVKSKIESRGWKGPTEYSQLVQKAAVELIRKGKEKEIVMAQKPIEGPFVVRKGFYDKDKFILLRNGWEEKPEEAFRGQIIEDFGNQIAELKRTPGSIYDSKEGKFVDLLQEAEILKGQQGIEIISCEFDDPDWRAVADPKEPQVVYRFETKRNRDGWVDSWIVSTKGNTFLPMEGHIR